MGFKFSPSRPPFLMGLAALMIAALLAAASPAQSGKGAVAGKRTLTLNVLAEGAQGTQISRDDFELYDGGIPQEIDSFQRVDAGTQIVLLVDNSANLRAEAGPLQKAAEEIANELFEDDQMMVVGYNESAEIIEDMTGELAKLRAATTKFVRKGFPNLFDALIAVSDALAHQAKTGYEKRAIILISDGYDSESKTKFDQALYALQEENIVLYAIQTPDRTRGALLRDKPKPPAVLEQLTVGTGGAIFQFDQAAEAAKVISDELRNRWYRLVYTPSGVNPINERRLLLMCRAQGVKLRTKGSHPGKYHQ